MNEKSTKKGFAILSTATLVVKLLSLIYVPVLFKILGGNRPFGIYNATYQIYTFIYVITNAGIPNAISKLISEFIAIGNYKSVLKVFKISRLLLLILGTLMMIVMLFLSGTITELLNYKEARYSVIALCPAILFTSVASAYRGYFQGRGNMKPTAISQVLEQILNTVFSLLFGAILIGYGVEAGCVGATIGTTLGALASAAYLIVIYEKNKHLGEVNLANNKRMINHSNKQILKRILKYSIPITLCIGIANAGALIDTSNMTARLIAGGANENYAKGLFGMYSKFITLIGLPISIISALAIAVLPAVSRAVALKDKELVQSRVNFAFKINFIISIPAAVGLFALSKPIYTLLGYSDGYEIMTYGAIIVIFMGLLQIQTSILQGIGKIYLVTLFSILGIIIKFITNYILIPIPSINIYGAIIGSLAGFLIPVILNYIYITKTFKFIINYKTYIYKTLISAIFMGLVSYAIYNISIRIIGFIFKGYLNNAVSLFASICIGIVLYFNIMLLSKGISNEELDIFPNRIKKLFLRKQHAKEQF